MKPKPPNPGIGERKGLLTVMRELPMKLYGKKLCRMVECRCDCGNSHQQRLTQWRVRPTKNCGCSRVANQTANVTRHGMSRSAVYKVWQGMISRCVNPGHIGWKRYGGRGIKVCARWRNSFEKFSADMGPRPEHHTIERINSDGNYEPSNCKWATHKEQSRNRRSNRVLTAFGQSMPVASWAEKFGVGKHVIASRLKNGWSAEDAVSCRRKS